MVVVEPGIWESEASVELETAVPVRHTDNLAGIYQA